MSTRSLGYSVLLASTVVTSALLAIAAAPARAQEGGAQGGATVEGEASIGVDASVEVAPPPPPPPPPSAGVGVEASIGVGEAAPATEPAPDAQPSDDTLTAPAAEVNEPEPRAAYSGPPPKEPRNNHFYLHVEGGYSYVNIAQFNNTNFLPMIDLLQGGGYTAGLGTGLRIAFFAAGARATYSRYATFDLASLGGELGVVLGLGPVDFYVRAGLAYGWMGSLNYSMLMIDPQTRVTGLIADGALGIDLYFSDHFSLGFGADVSWVNLARQGISGATTIANINLTQDGDAAGLQGRGFARVGVHF